MKNDHLGWKPFGLGLSMLLLLGGCNEMELEDVIGLFSVVLLEISILSSSISAFILLISLILS